MVGSTPRLPKWSTYSLPGETGPLSDRSHMGRITRLIIIDLVDHVFHYTTAFQHRVVVAH